MSLHGAIAADTYWGEPVGPYNNNRGTIAEIVDYLPAPWFLAGIDLDYSELRKSGDFTAIPVSPGERLPTDIDRGSLVRVVEDYRKVGGSRAANTDSPEAFDRTAKAMIDEHLYRGRDIGTYVGEALVCRTVSYGQPSLSRQRLVAKNSGVVGRTYLNGHESADLIEPLELGETYIMKKGCRVKISIAEVLEPTRGYRKRRRHIYLGRLLPGFGPSPAMQGV